jgi:hypothetical protein
MSKNHLLFFIVSLCSFSIPIFAQKNEVSFSVGGVLATDQTSTTTLLFACPATRPNCNIFTVKERTNPGVTFMGNFSRRIAVLGPATVYAETPVFGGPARDGTLSFRNGTFLGDVAAGSSSSFFFTPSAKIRFLDSSRVSPFTTLGGGLAHVRGFGATRNGGALQFGGGLDFKLPVPHLGFRAEVRDFFSGTAPQSSGPTQVSPAHQHTVFAGGGVVFKF